jgi:hypothetical protein
VACSPSQRWRWPRWTGRGRSHGADEAGCHPSRRAAGFAAGPFSAGADVRI